MGDPFHVGTVGTSCISDDGGEGACQSAMCPGDGTAPAPDGGFMYIDVPYPCVVCVAGAKPDADAASSSSSGSSGCTVAGGDAASLLGLGALALFLALGRRRSRVVPAGAERDRGDGSSKAR